MSAQIHVGDYITDGTSKFKVKRIGHTRLIGQIIWFAGKTLPEDFLLCDGSQLNRDTYQELFEAIGTTYGSGNGYDTFNIPLLIDNKFIEGSINPGIIKSPGLPNITGSFVSDIQANQTDTDPRNIEAFGETYLTELTGAFDAVYRTQCAVFESNTPVYGNMACGFRFNSAKCSSLYGNSSTVQPYSITLLPLIKYI